MLSSVSLENIAVARNITIDFSSGFNVITGSTGAGKSLIVNSLNILSGEKFSKELIRNGENKATVSGMFNDLVSFSEMFEACGISLDEEGGLQITRSIFSDGKSSLHINGKSSSVSQLKEIGSYLLNINGQNDSHALGDRRLYIQYLDEYASLFSDVASYRSVYKELVELNKELESLKDSNKEQKMLLDLYKQSLKEIDSAKITDPEEEEKIEKLLEKVKMIEKISKYSSLVYRALVQNEKGASAVYLLDKASQALEQLSDVLEDADKLSEKLKSIRYDLEDIGNKALSVLDGTDIDNPEKQIDLLESRLQLFRRLEKKYGNSLQEILDYREDVFQKIKSISSSDERMEELTAKITKVKTEAETLAQSISEKRKEAAKRLDAEILSNLIYLDMPKVRFETFISKTELGPNGFDSVDFMLSANLGEELQPLDKVGSGGELARVMLALKCVLANRHGVGCVVFDEIDTGVSGGTSEKIGLKLKQLSDSSQVICVTHSPQIASKADHHFCIQKRVVGERTESSVVELDEESRVSEIARLISGVSISETQRNAAKDLMK